MDPKEHAQSAADLATQAQSLADKAADLAQQATSLAVHADAAGGVPFIVTGLTIFVLACFVGYYVVWKVTPALHSPLMAVTNAVSSVIIVGALIATGASESGFSVGLGFLAVILASVNIFGGFLVTQRMLSMYKKKAPAGAAKK
ncbi:NAD(P) transhydrogenase subunit alpha [Aerophototrophica crusticola]|uniref:proton-translocating NAD(P)(+) transhydrogenase n=1 Tax=Aerophototrophica crusticola TaxID=1709002 RepID=A0A858R3I0_9PROT|nr:NAD(P) transhydrogenase subunit alpha [Rhodospirillaceae bacterium B3]